MAKVTVGADPEVFLYDNSIQKIIPACGLIGGTKRKPLHFDKSLRKDFTIQEDNVLVEFNIPPAHNLSQFVEYMQTALSGVTAYVATKGPYSLRYTSQHRFPMSQLQHEQAMAFGCSPDFDAYKNGDQHDPIHPDYLSEKGGAWRLAGAHIHVGVSCEVPAFVMATFADYFIGLSGVGFDKQQKRRELYGQPGRYRPTSYGIEYRSPSNYWLQESSHFYEIGNAAFGLGNFLSNTPIERIRKAYQSMPWGAVRQAIMTQDLALTQSIYQHVNDEGLVAHNIEDPEEV